MNSEKIVLFFLIPLIACALDVSACDEEVRWVSPSPQDFRSNAWRSQSPTGFSYVKLDMNGNGIPDIARLVVSDDYRKSALEICMDRDGDETEGRCHILAVSENISDIMGVDRRGPGCYSYVEDNEGVSSLDEVCGSGDVLEYFRFGSSSSYFIYDVEKEEFRRYWDSY